MLIWVKIFVIVTVAWWILVAWARSGKEEDNG